MKQQAHTLLQMKGPLEEDPLVNSAATAVLGLSLLATLAAAVGGSLASVLLAGALPYLGWAVWASRGVVGEAMAINDAIHSIAVDLRDKTMPLLLERSNKSDDHLNLLLLATGHLQRIDANPPWVCVELPWPAKWRHLTFSVEHYGWWHPPCAYSRAACPWQLASPTQPSPVLQGVRRRLRADHYARCQLCCSPLAAAGACRRCKHMADCAWESCSC
jgi:hypothetical protein